MPRRRYVVSFANGPARRVEAMRREIAELLPGFEHHALDEANWLSLIRKFPPFSVAHTAALIGTDCDMEMFRHALALAPGRMLAYNDDGDRFHLQASQALSSLLFLRGEPVHRIHLRPWRDDTIHFAGYREILGRMAIVGPRIAILSPYLPWPLSHGGAVRIFNLIEKSAARVNVELFAFIESQDVDDLGPLKDLCTKITLVRKPEFRRVRWASFRPPEVLEFDTPAMREALEASEADLLQTEFTQLAGYGGDILVEHDITMDLAAQENARTKSVESAWNLWRWKRFEGRALERFAHVVVMSEKDRAQIQARAVHVLPNGVDLERYQPGPEHPGLKLLFIGSFRHFPNALAYRFLVEQFWPLLRAMLPGAELEVIAGPNPQMYYPFGAIPQAEGIRVQGFVSDVRLFYNETNLVLIPTPVSAGTNIKALEAMAMQRAILSTPSGVNGLDLMHGKNVWIAHGAEEFAIAAMELLRNDGLRQRLAKEARGIAEAHFDWRGVALRQEELWHSILR